MLFSAGSSVPLRSIELSTWNKWKQEETNSFLCTNSAVGYAVGQRRGKPRRKSTAPIGAVQQERHGGSAVALRAESRGTCAGGVVGAVQAAALTSSTCRCEETSESVEGMGQRAWAAGAGLLFCLTVQLTPECMFSVCLSVRARQLSWDTARLCRDEELGLQEPQSVSGAGELKELLFRRWAFFRCLVAAWALQA